MEPAPQIGPHPDQPAGLESHVIHLGNFELTPAKTREFIEAADITISNLRAIERDIITHNIEEGTDSRSLGDEDIDNLAAESDEIKLLLKLTVDDLFLDKTIEFNQIVKGGKAGKNIPYEKGLSQEIATIAKLKAQLDSHPRLVLAKIERMRRQEELEFKKLFATLIEIERWRAFFEIYQKTENGLG